MLIVFKQQEDVLTCLKTDELSLERCAKCARSKAHSMLTSVWLSKQN